MKELGAVTAILTSQLSNVIVNTLSKAAMKNGMNNFVFVMYSNAFAASFLFLFIFCRKLTLPPLSYNILGQLCVVGFFSCCYQLLKYFGIAYSSPTLASAMSDLIPAFTFIFAIIFRMEKLDWKAKSSWAKSIGTLVSITGALMMSLYKGQVVINNNQPFKSFHGRGVLSIQFDWVVGAVLLAASSCFLSINFILVKRILGEYPSEPVVVLIRLALTSILSVPAALISEKDLNAMKLGFNMELIAIGCSAIFVLSFGGVIYTWAIGKRGPVYVAMFNPLEIIFAAILGITFLGDSLYVGSVIGACIIVIGFYAVLWGKTQEEKVDENTSFGSHDNETPLLLNSK